MLRWGAKEDNASCQGDTSAVTATATSPQVPHSCIVQGFGAKENDVKSESMQVLRLSLQYHNMEEADTGTCVNVKYHQEAAKEACGGWTAQPPARDDSDLPGQGQSQHWNTQTWASRKQIQAGILH